MNTTTIIQDDDLDWTVRIVRPGDSYGRGLGLVNDAAEPMVEFFDRRYIDTFRAANGGNGWGQFVSRYFLSTLLTLEGGLNLDGGIPDWSISGEGMKKVLKWLAGRAGGL